MARVHAGMAKSGMTWFAVEQSSGKGQRGKLWESEPGKNIAMSMVLEPKQFNLSEQFFLSSVIAIACFEFFSTYAGDETRIKWPNDLYWRDRKAGGILIENVFQGKDWKYAIAGIGININQVRYGIDLKNTVSLKQITGKDFDPISLGEGLCALILAKLEELGQNPIEKTIEAYNQHLFGLNEVVKLKKGNRVFETLIKGVSSAGRLVTVDESEREFEFGEVEWV